MPTANVYNDYKRIECLLAEGELPEPIALGGWPNWSPNVILPPKYEHTLPTTVQYLTIMQVVAIKRLEFIDKVGIVSVEVYA